MGGALKKRRARAGLDDVARVHDGHPIGDLGHHPEIVGDEEERHAPLALQRLQQLQDLRLEGDVQGRAGFIGDEEAGPGRDGDGDHDALLHPPRELVGIFVIAPLAVRDPHGLEEPEDTGTARVGAVDGQDLADLPSDGEHGVQRALRLLKDHPDASAADHAHRRLGQGQQVFAVESHLPRQDARALRQEAGDGEGGHGLPAARLAEQAQGLAPSDMEIHPVDGAHGRLAGADPGAEPGDFKETRGP